MELPGGPINDTDRAAMHADPPAETLRWLAAETGAARIVGLEVLQGGSTSAMHRVDIERLDGSAATIVLRRYVLAHVHDAPELFDRENAALELLAGSSLPVPDLLAADRAAERCDAPALVMSFLAGSPRWELGRRDRFAQSLAETIASIHDTRVALDDTTTTIAPIRPYGQESWEPPRWTGDPAMWEQAIAIHCGPVPTTDVGFVHRDFHPGNLLWRRGRLTGVIDWQAAGVGPASIDPGHCRLNFLYYAPSLADRLRVAWEDTTGLTYDPWADVVCIIGALDSLRDHPPSSAARAAIESTLTRAVSDLTL